MMVESRDVISVSPENRETPIRDARSWVTPNSLFFVRSHYDNPEIDLENWSLKIEGCVENPIELSLDRLKALPQRSLFTTIECAGNGRSFLQNKVEGVQWNAGAVGHAEWSGVPLKYVLEEAGLKSDAIEVVFAGADSGMEKGFDEPTNYARSLPLEKAFHPDTLLATHMNGEPLTESHGSPLRLLVPGWYGVVSVKWLTRIEAVSTPFQGYFQTVKYTFQKVTGRGIQTEVVGVMPIKSEIVRPANNDVIGIGTNRIFGLAWAGEDAVEAVEMSVDGGNSWSQAELIGPQAPYSWTLWEYLWEVVSPGNYSLQARAISSGGQVQPTKHDLLREGYLINFTRTIHVRVDASRRSQDILGDARTLEQELVAVAEERSGWSLDVEMEFDSGAGI